MPIRRIFLDWSQPALELISDELLQRSSSDSFIDLSHLVLVFYGRQAGRRCEELLLKKADGAFVPPRIVTVGELPELLYLPKRPFASILVQQLVWAEALKSIPPDRLRLLMNLPPDPEDQSAWLRVGELLRKQHEELARDQLDFTDVWKQGMSLPGFDEVPRWKLMAEIQKRYWELLDSYELWDQQTARLEAIKRNECHTDLEIVTIGTVDLNRTVRSMLDQIADHVTAYVPAPGSLADRFDLHGCLIPDGWTGATVELQPEQLLIADDPASQCSTVLSVLSSLNGHYALDDITIGVPDPQLVVPLQRMLDEYAVPSHWPVDRLLSATGPYRLLKAVADFLEEPSAMSFASLLRHPDLGRWLDSQELPADWLNSWDSYYCNHLPRNLDRIIPGDNSETVKLLKKSIQKLLNVFPRKSAPLTSWGGPVRTLLKTIYPTGGPPASQQEWQQVQSVCEDLNDAFRSHSRVPQELDCPVPAHEAIALTLKNAECELYRGESEPAVQLVGWLEMPLDDAPVAIVTTFNETFVPKSVNHDLFLPNRLRSHLGIEDNARRYARDLYLLSTLVHSRKELRLIVARRNASHDPLTPSRLLFATDPERIAERVLAFYETTPREPLQLPASPRTIALEPAFPIPQPVPRLEPRTTLRVTEFRDYLASPYRYYLRHVLRLEGQSDQLDELDGAAFGTMVHEVLKRFGRSNKADSQYPQSISDFLHHELKTVIEEQYGPEPLAAVLIQAEQARRRLTAFANWQAKWRQEGWEIRAVEYALPEPVAFMVGEGRKILLKGRIDRIDYHRDAGKWSIFDYKTGDSGAAPEKTHRYQGEWVDLQLPLYRHLAIDLCGDDPVQMGYITLPRDVNAVAAKFADWTQEDLLEADDTARKVARHILDQKFWVKLPEPSGAMAEYDGICQTGVFGQEILL